MIVERNVSVAVWHDILQTNTSTSQIVKIIIFTLNFVLEQKRTIMHIQAIPRQLEIIITYYSLRV